MSDDNESLQMLTRSSQIGEFYVMSPPQVEPKGSALHTCDMMIFDEERDCHVRITWEDALNATLVNEEKFMTANAGKTMADGKTNTYTLQNWATKAREWLGYNEGKLAGKTAEEKTAEFEALDRNIRIVVARPFIEHLMHNVVLAVSGRDTGATLFGPADMQLSVSYFITRT